MTDSEKIKTTDIIEDAEKMNNDLLDLWATKYITNSDKSV